MSGKLYGDETLIDHSSDEHGLSHPRLGTPRGRAHYHQCSKCNAWLKPEGVAVLQRGDDFGAFGLQFVFCWDCAIDLIDAGVIRVTHG